MMNYGNNIELTKEEKQKIKVEKKQYKLKLKEEKQKEILDRIENTSIKTYLFNIQNLLFTVVFALLILCIFFLCFFTDYQKKKDILIDNLVNTTSATSKINDITPYARFGISSTNTLKYNFNNINVNLTGNVSSKTWTGLTDFTGQNIWTDGNNIYYSYGSIQYVLDISTSNWVIIVWTGLTDFNGQYVWTDGNNIYYSYGSLQYVLDISNYAWLTKTWTGLTDFNGNTVWTDGNDIYYSASSSQYVLNISNYTWSTMTWSGLTSFSGVNIWSDGINIYYSTNTAQYILNISNHTWSTMTWGGLTKFRGDNIWTDGNNIYYSLTSNQYVLNISNHTWSTMTWTTYSSLIGQNIWTDGNNIYFSSGSNQYVFDKPLPLITPTLSASLSGTYMLHWTHQTVTGLIQSFDIYKDSLFYANTNNFDYPITENGFYQVKQKSNISDYTDSELSNAINVTGLVHIKYSYNSNVYVNFLTYLSSDLTTNSINFYYPINFTGSYPATIITINNSLSNFYVLDTIILSYGNANFDYVIGSTNTKAFLFIRSSSSSELFFDIEFDNAIKLSGNTFIYDSSLTTDKLDVGDYILNNVEFTSNNINFNNIFVNTYNYLVYQFDNDIETTRYFISNFGGNYIPNSTYNYYLISFEDNGEFTENDIYFSIDDIFFKYYRLATQTDFENIDNLNNQLVQQTENYTFLNLFGAIIDTQVNTARSLLNFELFGVNFWNLILFFMTMMLIFMTFKFIKGGKN